PGTYAVTFTLPGFKVIKRDGIVLEGAFSAQVNAALSVGAMEETVTVTGESPIVDTQSTQNQAVLNRSVLDVLPAARTMQGGAACLAHQQSDPVSQRGPAGIPQRHVRGIRRLHRAAQNSAAHGTADAEAQTGVGVLQVAGGHAALRRRVRRR